MCLAHLTLLLFGSLAARSAEVPSAGGLARCAAIAAPDARLACYDTLAGRPADRAPIASAPSPAAAPRATASVAPAPAPAANDSRNFGLTPAQMHVTSAGPTAIQARVAKIIESRLGIGHPSVVLDNGQTWTFTETNDDARLGPGDPVTIKRAALGSFLMTTPSKHTYHVHRTQ
jgi:hypothetical protein